MPRKDISAALRAITSRTKTLLHMPFIIAATTIPTCQNIPRCLSSRSISFFVAPAVTRHQHDIEAALVCRDAAVNIARAVQSEAAAPMTPLRVRHHAASLRLRRRGALTKERVEPCVKTYGAAHMQHHHAFIIADTRH